MQEICPQCLKAMTGTASRLVQDSCGHKKCRICLLIEENGCRLCESQLANNDVNAKKETKNTHYIKFDSNHRLNIENNEESHNINIGNNPYLKEEVSISNCTVIANNYKKSSMQGELINEIYNVQLPRFKVEEHDEHILKTRLDHLGDISEVNSVKSEENKELCNTNAKYEFEETSTVSHFESKIKKVTKKTTLPSYFIHISDDPLSYNCTICHKLFSNKSHIKKHAVCLVQKTSIDENVPNNGTKNESEKTIKCNECEQKFAKRSHLEWHERSHSGERPFECNTCGKTFTQKGKLNRHIKLHSGIKPYICEKCNKRFSSKESLRSHMRTHLGEKPFKCQHCPSSFTEQSNLNKHVTIHTKEKPFMCAECGKTFSLKWRLTVHGRSHNRIRTHRCPQCPRAFSNSKDMHRHLVIHSGVKPFSCILCNTNFRRKDNLERHMRNTHPGSHITTTKKVDLQHKNCIKEDTSVMLSTTKISNECIKKESTHSEMKTAVIEKSTNSNSNYETIDRTNAVNVIKPQATVITSNANYKSGEDKIIDQFKPPLPPKSNAVPVINGPVKLAFKTSAFKNNYNIKNKDFIIDDNVNIYQRILSPMSVSQNKDKSDQTRALCADSIIKSTDKERESDLLRHKMSSRISVPRIHYETSFEHSTHSIIKNIKFKLPPEYTSQASKFNLRNKTETINKGLNNTNKDSNYFDGSTTLGFIGLNSAKPVNIESTVDLPKNSNLTPLTPVYLEEKSVDEITDGNNCVRTITKASSNVQFYDADKYLVQSDTIKEVHWRKRTSQSLQPKLN